MCHGFQITYFTIQQLSIVLMIALLEHFNVEIKEKIPFRSNDSSVNVCSRLCFTQNMIFYAI